MEIINSKWHVHLQFNQVFVVGIAPLSYSFVYKIIESEMLSIVIRNIDKAKEIGECVVITYSPATLKEIIKDNLKNNSVAFGFTIIFKNLFHAKEYMRILQNQQ